MMTKKLSFWIMATKVCTAFARILPESDTRPQRMCTMKTPRFAMSWRER
jgi:hypothetical protein